MTKTYSTRQTAQMVNVTTVNLLRWVKRGKVRPSIVVPLGSAGREMWRWTEADLAKEAATKRPITRRVWADLARRSADFYG